MAVEKNIIKSNAEYTRAYERLRGVDLSDLAKGDGGRFGFLENMYVDYEAGRRLESIPGFRKIMSLGERINGIFQISKKDIYNIVIHAGTSLYFLDIRNRDSADAPKLIATGLSNSRSSAVTLDAFLLFLDGKELFLIADEKAIFRTRDIELGYTPITYVDGEKYEERNLISPLYKQQFTVKSIEDHSYGTFGLEYAVLDYKNKLCSVTRFYDMSYIPIPEEIHIPSYTYIENEKYKVVEIADFAFQNSDFIKKLVTNSNLVKIGDNAFCGCSNLNTVILSKTVESVGEFCFEGCEKLSDLYLGDSIVSLGESSFAECGSLEHIYYSKSPEAFERIENVNILEGKSVNFNTEYSEITLSLALKGDVMNVKSVIMDEYNIEYTYEGINRSVKLCFANKDLILGKTIMVEGKLHSYGSDEVSYKLSLLGITPTEFILGCTMVCEFDGNIFISGNPNLPSIVCHSTVDRFGDNNCLYFSVKNYLAFEDNYPVKSICSSDGYLLVLNGEEESGDSRIHFYSPEGEGKNRKYRLRFVRKSPSPPKDSTAFMGEAVFACSGGIYSASSKNDEPGITCLSEKISSLLSAEPGENIRFAEWLGYLVVSCGGRFYLADSRDRYKHNDSLIPEWYFLNGIGTHTNGRRIYKYSNKKVGNYLLSDRPDEIAEGIVYSAVNEDENISYFTKEDGKNYSVYKTDEFRGGDFHPATELFVLGNLLFFGTDNGDVCVFNNDMRGVAPPTVAAMDDFDTEEYKKEMGERIHPYYYSFDGYAPQYTVATPLDDCGVPYLEKSTVRSSLVLKINCLAPNEISILAKTDKHSPKEVCKIRTGGFDFSGLDFSRLAISPSGPSTISISEWERGWIAKQIILSTKGFRAPISLDSIYYRYKIKGKIKNM